MSRTETITKIETEKALVKRLQRGDAAAWNELCAQYGEPLFLYALHRSGGDPASAEDIRQETLFAAVKSIGRYRGDVPLFGWLCGIARHKAGDALRKNWREGTSLPDDTDADNALLQADPAGSPDRILEDRQANADLVVALWSLPDDYRQALVLRYQQGRPVDEIAQKLNRTYKAAESLLERARQALRNLLGDKR